MNLDKVIATRDNKTIYRDGDRRVKLFSEGYSKSDVLNEALNQARVEETGINVPKVLEVTTIDGRWAIVSEYVEGKTLAQLIEENYEKKAEYIELLVDLQMMIHSKSCPLLNRLNDTMRRKIADTDFDAITRYNLHTCLEAMPKHNSVCHGDFNFTNVVIAEDGTPYIIDWSHASEGDAAADVARTYLLFWMNGDITGAEMYLDTFCEKSGIDKAYIEKWMPLVAAAQTVGCRETEREFLMSWVTGADKK